MGKKRDFKGVWIGKDVWLTRDLTLQEKVLLVEIDSLDNADHCYASNDYFANFFGLSKKRISIVIQSLSEKKYIKSKIDKKSGNKRTITTLKYPGRGARQRHKDPIPGNGDSNRIGHPSGKDPQHTSQTRHGVSLILKAGLKKQYRPILGNGVTPVPESKDTPIPGSGDHNNTKANNPKKETISQRCRKRDLALAKQKAGLEFADTVEKICEERGEAPFMPSERVTWRYYRDHLAKLGPDWLRKATKKLRQLTTWRDSSDKRTTTDLKKAFGAWMGRVAGYKKKEIA